jgi:secretion/DNA translocation related TadE-like protein
LLAVSKRGLVTNFSQTLRTAARLEEGVITAFLAVVLAGGLIFLGALLLGLQALAMQQRITAAVDLAALAAADTQRGLVSGIVCENAESILKTVDAVMTTCRIVGDGVMVSGQFSLPPLTLQASAIAGEK